MQEDNKDNKKEDHYHQKKKEGENYIPFVLNRLGGEEYENAINLFRPALDFTYESSSEGVNRIKLALNLAVCHILNSALIYYEEVHKDDVGKKTVKEVMKNFESDISYYYFSMCNESLKNFITQYENQLVTYVKHQITKYRDQGQEDVNVK